MHRTLGRHNRCGRCSTALARSSSGEHVQHAAGRREPHAVTPELPVEFADPLPCWVCSSMFSPPPSSKSSALCLSARTSPSRSRSPQRSHHPFTGGARPSQPDPTAPCSSPTNEPPQLKAPSAVYSSDNTTRRLRTPDAATSTTASNENAASPDARVTTVVCPSPLRIACKNQGLKWGKASERPRLA